MDIHAILEERASVVRPGFNGTIPIIARNVGNKTQHIAEGTPLAPPRD
ncbi:hypothetical protein [Aquibium carbonis]|nr:hypothetical protein [Aquibium carbonis]